LDLIFFNIAFPLFFEILEIFPSFLLYHFSLVLAKSQQE